MIRKNILYVEDDDKNVLSFQDAITDWNAENADAGRVFNPLVAKNMAEARDVILSSRVDCALLDLRIPEAADGRSDADAGNKLAEEVLHRCGMPMAIISGHTGDLDDRLTEGGLIAVFDKSKADSFAEAVAWSGGHWGMMHVLTEARRKFEMLTSEVFVRRIWPQWKEFIELSGDDQDRLATIVSRQFMSHAAEFLGLDDNPDGESWHPFECYVVPPLIDSRPHTGDVFDLDDGRWIVVSPQCDMATGKVESILMAKCAVGLQDFKGHVEAIKNPPSENRRNKADKFLRKQVNQDLPQSLHFLPPLPEEDDPTIINFPELRTIPLKELTDVLAKRKASVSQPFLGNLVQRFGAYLSRMGQPNIDVTHF